MMVRRLLVLLIVLSCARARALDSAHEEAAVRFDRALRLVDQGDLSGGLAEFRQAYTLAPNVGVLFNLGLLYAEMQRPVDAARCLREALASPSGLSPEQMQRARLVLDEQVARIGFLTISASVPEGVVEIDNVQVARLPLSEPLQVASGARIIGLVVQGHAPARREVVIAGQVNAKVEFEPVPIDGRLAHLELQSSLPGADVFVDGQRVARTPLESSITVAPGTRAVRLTRPGYLPIEQTLDLSDGARATLKLDPELDGAALASQGGELILEPSEPLSVASVDGIMHGVIRAPLVLPHGPHRVRVERGGFDVSERDVVVPLAQSIRVPVQLHPTATTRASYIERTRRARKIRGAMLAATTATLAAGLALALWSQHELPGARSDLREVERDSVWMGNGSCDGSGLQTPGGVVPLSELQLAACERRLSAAHDEVAKLDALRIVGWALAAASGAGALTAGVLLWRADDPNRYERPTLVPTLRFGAASGELQLSGRF
jgi:PEGA domain